MAHVNKLAERKRQPFLAETAAAYRLRPLMVRMLPKAIQIYEKGRRTVVSVPYAAVYELGLKIAAKNLEKAKK